MASLRWTGICLQTRKWPNPVHLRLAIQCAQNSAMKAHTKEEMTNQNEANWAQKSASIAHGSPNRPQTLALSTFLCPSKFKNPSLLFPATPPALPRQCHQRTTPELPKKECHGVRILPKTWPAPEEGQRSAAPHATHASTGKHRSGTSSTKQLNSLQCTKIAPGSVKIGPSSAPHGVRNWLDQTPFLRRLQRSALCLDLLHLGL
jgi:hypothetical protein